MLVIGGGYIGLEIGSVYAALGSKITVVEARRISWRPPTATSSCRWKRSCAAEFEAIYTSTKVAKLEARPEGIVAALGRRGAVFTHIRPRADLGRPAAELRGTSLDKAGVKQDERGFITVDKQRRTNVAHIQAIGDIAGEPGLAHKATAEARVAVEVASG